MNFSNPTLDMINLKEELDQASNLRDARSYRKPGGITGAAKTKQRRKNKAARIARRLNR